MARLLVKVHPRAKSTCMSGKSGDAHRLHVNAAPVDGNANDACIRFLADIMGLPRARVAIVSGLTSRTKVVQIDGITQAEAESRLPK